MTKAVPRPDMEKGRKRVGITVVRAVRKARRQGP